MVPWSAPEGAIPLGPYVIVRLAPDLMSALKGALTQEAAKAL